MSDCVLPAFHKGIQQGDVCSAAVMHLKRYLAIQDPSSCTSATANVCSHRVALRRPRQETSLACTSAKAVVAALRPASHHCDALLSNTSSIGQHCWRRFNVRARSGTDRPATSWRRCHGLAKPALFNGAQLANPPLYTARHTHRSHVAECRSGLVHSRISHLPLAPCATRVRVSAHGAEPTPVPSGGALQNRKLKHV